MQFSLGPLPRTQALRSSTFKPPPLDGSLALPEIYDWHLINSPAHPLLTFTQSDGTLRIICWREFVRAAHEAGYILQRRFGEVKDIIRPPVIGIIASSGEWCILVSTLPRSQRRSPADTLTYFTVMIGISRMGYTVFPISPRNSPSTISHLIKKTNISHILVGTGDSFSELMTAIGKDLSTVGYTAPSVSNIPCFDGLYLSYTDTPFEPLPPVKFDMCAPALILHSSGEFSIHATMSIHTEHDIRNDCSSKASHSNALRPSSTFDGPM